jgi:hypothetical protein
MKDSIWEHLAELGPIFSWIGACFAAIAGILVRKELSRIDSIEKEQIALRTIIPHDAIKDGHMMITYREFINMCELSRSRCTNHLLTEELTTTMRVIKQAIILLVLHTDAIPKEDRDKIIKELAGN